MIRKGNALVRFNTQRFNCFNPYSPAGITANQTSPEHKPTESQQRDVKMNLKKANPPTPPASSVSPTNQPDSQSPSPSASAAIAAVGELVESLNQRKMYREVTLALRSGLRDARAEFSFLRVRGLRCLLKFLRSVAESDSVIRLFCLTQSLSDLQGLLLIFSLSSIYFCDHTIEV